MLNNNTMVFRNLPVSATGQCQGKVAVFIDAAHIFYAASTLSIEIDYSKLLAQLVPQGQLLRAHFYSGVDPNNAKQQGFLLWMRRNGYRVVTKEITQKETGDGGHRAIDFCVEITTDMLAQTAVCDTVVLVTGDGRFAHLLKHLAYSNTRTELVSLQSITSEKLMSEADCAVDFAEFKDAIAKRHIAYKRSRFSAA